MLNNNENPNKIYHFSIERSSAVCGSISSFVVVFLSCWEKSPREYWTERERATLTWKFASMRSFYKVPKVREDAQGWPFCLQKRRERAIRSKCCSRGQLRHLITPDILNRPAGDIAYFITLVLHYYINSSCYTFRSCIFRYLLHTFTYLLLVTAYVLSTMYLCT